MSDLKMTCPACDAHTSSVGIAARDGEPCPHCGSVLPAWSNPSDSDEVTRLRNALEVAERKCFETQEHIAYHLRNFRPGADMRATGDLAVDMAHYAEQMKAQRDVLRDGITALADMSERRFAAYAIDEPVHLALRALLNPTERTET